MALYRDPTANAAIGSVGREWKKMVSRALLLRKTNREPSEREKTRFIGIYSRLLTAPLDELEKLEKGN